MSNRLTVGVFGGFVLKKISRKVFLCWALPYYNLSNIKIRNRKKCMMVVLSWSFHENHTILHSLVNRNSNIGSCKYLLKSSGEFRNQDRIQFQGDMNGVANPITVKMNKWEVSRGLVYYCLDNIIFSWLLYEMVNCNTSSIWILSHNHFCISNILVRFLFPVSARIFCWRYVFAMMILIQAMTLWIYIIYNMLQPQGLTT